MKILYVIFAMVILVGVSKVLAYFTDSDFNTVMTFIVAFELFCHEANQDRRKRG